jgi:hypothetical protein
VYKRWIGHPLVSSQPATGVPALVQKVEMDLGRVDAGVTERLLHRPDVVSVLELYMAKV